MIVMKFGGTSVEDAAAIQRAVEIIRREIPQQPLVIVSACAGVTSQLLSVAHLACEGDQDEAYTVLNRLRERHLSIANELLTEERLEHVQTTIEEKFQELRNYIQGVFLLGELTPRSLDAFASFGEFLSSLLIHQTMIEKQMPSQLVDARTIMITDGTFTSAQPLMEKISPHVKRTLLPLLQGGKVVVTQGFVGAAEDGSTTTIGRGGSDFSAAIFGAALGATEIQIWTDVDGMMTADPRVVSSARLIEFISYDEASELAYFGAKVLHPRTILPAVEKKIPVKVLNSLRPEVKGTLIVPTLDAAKLRSDRNALMTSIAFKRGIIVINVNSSRMLMAHGFLAKLFSIFAEHEKSVDVVATSEVSVSLTVDNENGIDDIVNDLQKIGETRIFRKKAIICIVGEGMKRTPGIAARIFGSLAKAGVNVEMVSEGASEINLTLVVDGRDAETAVQVLHKDFFS